MSEEADYDDGGPDLRAWFLGSRWSVIGLGFLVGAVLSAIWCLDKLDFPLECLHGWGLILAGPFSGIGTGIAPDCGCGSLLAAPGIFAHPLRPRRWTGAITAVALALWFFVGWATVVTMAFAG
jgi:hypothetical protein